VKNSRPVDDMLRPGNPFTFLFKFLAAFPAILVEPQRQLLSSTSLVRRSAQPFAPPVAFQAATPSRPSSSSLVSSGVNSCLLKSSAGDFKLRL